MSGRFIGVGVGPGDPELITLKAARLIREADVIAFIANEDGHSQARQIARFVVEENTSMSELPVPVPMSENRDLANRAYDEAAINIQAALEKNYQVVFLCEGDPLFFGSFAYLLDRLKAGNQCEVVPGISSVHAAASALQLPLTIQKESFAVVSGRHSEDYLVDVLNSHDSVVIMKAGRSRQRILSAISQAGRNEDAQYLEYIGRNNERIERDISALKNRSGPYFSVFVVTRNRWDTV